MTELSPYEAEHDIESAGRFDLSLEGAIALIERGHEPALRLLARRTHLDPLAFDLLLECRHEVVLKTLAAREDLSASQQFRLLRKRVPKVTRRLARNQTLAPVLFQEILQAYPPAVAAMLDHPAFDAPVGPADLECLDERTLADVLRHRGMRPEVVRTFWSHPSLGVLQSVLETVSLDTEQQEALVARADEGVTLALVRSGRLHPPVLKKLLGDHPSDEVAQALVETYALSEDQVRALYGRGPRMRTRILASARVDPELRHELQRQEAVYLSVAELNDLFLVDLHRERPTLAALFPGDLYEPLELAALLEALRNGTYDAPTGDLLVSILLLEAETNRTSVSCDPYPEADAFTFEMLFDGLVSEETLAKVSGPMRFWLETSLDSVRRHMRVLSGDVLTCEYTAEHVFLTGFRLNRYVEAVCGSDFCPVHLLELAVRLGGPQLSRLAAQTLRRRLEGPVGDAVRERRHRVTQAHDDWATEARIESDRWKDWGLYEQHKRETGR